MKCLNELKEENYMQNIQNIHHSEMHAYLRVCILELMEIRLT